MRRLRWLALCLCGCALVQAQAQEGPAALQQRWKQLQERGEQSPSIRSSQEDGAVASDVYATVDLPLERMAEGFATPEAACELFSLHLFIRSCVPAVQEGAATLTVLGGSRRLPAALSGRVVYHLQREEAQPGYTRSSLSAAQGPFGTHDYRLVFEGLALDGGHSFVHFGYRYGYGTLAHMAFRVYQATAGRKKIGFTLLGTKSDGQPDYVQDERGGLERNAMRSYLCLLAFAQVQDGAEAQRRERRERLWFALTERYPLQLHEIDEGTYLAEKQADLLASSRH